MTKENLSLAERLKRDSHRICSLILNSDMEWIDISIEINNMRELCAMEDPDKLDLFEAVYAARFNRLWEQWRLPREENAAELATGWTPGDAEWDWREREPRYKFKDDDDEWGLASSA